MNACLVAAAAAALALACEDASSPAEPVWGKQACGSCTMLVSEPRTAAQVATEDGARVFFDDPGCMANWVHQHGGKAQRLWVHAAAGGWIDARTARYARGASTPMNFGFVPSESGDAQWADVEAAALAREGAR